MLLSTAMFPVVQQNLLTVKKISPQPASRAVLTIEKHLFMSTMFNNLQFYGNDAEKAPENENTITNMLFVCISAGEHHPENYVLQNTSLSCGSEAVHTTDLFRAGRGCHHPSTSLCCFSHAQHSATSSAWKQAGDSAGRELLPPTSC